MTRNGIGPVTHNMVGGEVYHKPSGQYGRITRVIPDQNLVYVDFGADQDDLTDAEDLKF